jgi:zinc transport system substrate-binding protein
MKLSVPLSRKLWVELRHSMITCRRARCVALVATAVSALVLSGCSPDSGEERLLVVVTVPPLAGLVDRVAPDQAVVTIMIPPGANPVTYEPSLSRVRAASSADLYVSVGHPAFIWESAWLAGLLEPADPVVISGAAGCDLLPDDPHVWMSMDCARSLAERIAAAVQSTRPSAAESVASSLADLLAEMDDLKAQADGALGSRRGASFLTLHPAWGYLAHEYGLEQIAILDHGSGDAGPAELAAIVRRARELGLSNVVVQPQFSAEPALLVAGELGGATVTLDPLTRDWAASFRRAVSVLSEQVRP